MSDIALFMRSCVVTKRFVGYSVISDSESNFSPVIGSMLYIASTSSSKNDSLNVWLPNSPNDAMISIVSPVTRNVPGISSLRVREYRALTSWRRNGVLGSSMPTLMVMAVLWKSSGLPQPYMHDTLDTTITSLRPESSVATVLSLRRSISSFIDRSFSMYVSVVGRYASGW